MKKKIMSLCLVVALAATAVIGGTLAYFTDTDAETNVFTTGKVDIDLEETFQQNSKLFPGKENAVKKEVWIELEEGSEDSYVWYTWKIPTALDSIDGTTGTNNIVHVNSFGRTWDSYRENQKYWADDQTEALPLDKTWDHDPNVEMKLAGPEGFIGTEIIDGVMYNVYLVLYHGKLSRTEDDLARTSTAMSQVYMDAGVDTKTVEGKTVYVDKNGKTIEYDFNKNIKILVDAYAIQAEGFEDVYAAYAANPVVLMK